MTEVRLLLEAFALPEPRARASWKRWRDAADLDRLAPGILRVLPVVAHARPEWLAGDPGRAVIQGLCRKAWTQNQLGFRLLARTVARLREAGVEEVVLTGSTAFALLSSRHKSLRPLETLEIQVGREALPAAFGALTGAGWKLLPGYPEPAAAWLEDADGARLKLGWGRRPRALESAPLLGTVVQLFPPEEMLVETLLGVREECELDWRWDALALLAVRRVNWLAVFWLMDGGETGTARLRELREEWNIAVPASLLLCEGLWRIRRDYRWNVRNGGARAAVSGFAAYCARRWWRVFIRRSQPS